MSVTRAHDVAVRQIREADAGSLLQLQRRLDEETEMMMLEPGERSESADEVRPHLQETIASPNSTIIVAESDSQIVGYVSAVGGSYRRTRHSAYVVIGVSRAYQGRGIGRSLLGAMRSWAVQRGVARLELTVRAEDEPARRLYERVGFQVEGVRRGSLQVNGELIDELAMALVLPPRP
jgi:RimJ/RimL family protein N-acetyltransferase